MSDGKAEIIHDPEDEEMSLVVKDGAVIGRISRFNNGVAEDGTPIPLE